MTIPVAKKVQHRFVPDLNMQKLHCHVGFCCTILICALSYALGDRAIGLSQSFSYFCVLRYILKVCLSHFDLAAFSMPWDVQQLYPFSSYSKEFCLVVSEFLKCILLDLSSKLVAEVLHRHLHNTLHDLECVFLPFVSPARVR